MVLECCVCKSLRKDAILYRFPSGEKRRKKWLKCFKRRGLALPTDHLPQPISNSFICAKHFEKRFILPETQRLKGTAYPTLFTNDEVINGIPLIDNTENIDPRAEHNYALNKHYDHTYCKDEPEKELNVMDAIPSTPVPLQNISGPSVQAKQAACSSLDGQPQVHIPANPFIVEAVLSSSRMVTESVEAEKNIQQSQVPDSKKNKRRHMKGPNYRRRRLVTKLKKLSPACQIVYDEYKKSKRQANFYRRAGRAMKFSKENSFQRLTQNMNPHAKTIMKMQINLCTKQKKGRRFTLEEKLVALSIMKQSPKCYRFLHKIFILPSRSTLNKMVAGLKIESGICRQIFDLMRKETKEWNEKKKLCSVIFDEISLEAGLSYDKNKDSINGLVELDEKKKEFADHALVFMVRGAVYKWQQPIAFYFCQGATKGTELKKILTDIIEAVAGCGLKPISVICDQGSAFQSALRSLKSDTARDQLRTEQIRDDTITISGVNLMVIFDPPHLIKGLRNNFLTKNILADGKISTWKDIVDVYEADCNNAETRMLHKLTDQHIIPDKIKKMKVKNCVKVFSHTLSSALSYTANFSHYADGRPVSETMANTAEIVKFFDKLFDSVNGAVTIPKKKGKVLRTAVTETSPHHQFWIESIEKLENIKYVDARGNTKSVPSLKNFISTIKTFIKLWQFFKEKNIQIMRPRYFNSDPVENFFGQIRAYNYRNNDPNCHSFMCTFKSLLITRIIKFHSDTYNCEDDSAGQIINLQALFANTDNEIVEPGHPGIVDDVIIEQAQREQLNVLHSRAYTAGWVVKKTLNKKGDCITCRLSLTSEKGAIHKWISQREYNAASNRLVYPSQGAVRCFGKVIKETNGFLEQNAHLEHLSTRIKYSVNSKNLFRFFKCNEHREITLDYFITLTIKFSIINWCTQINKILKGTDVARLKDRVLPTMQQKALEKYKKKLKNKSFNK